jgi:predicted PurR-regulated permease PerM
LKLLPNLGPVLSAIPAIAVAYFTVSPAMALAVLILYILVQQIENNLIVPVVMSRVIGLSPVITIILLLTGFKVAGIMGAISGHPHLFDSESGPDRIPEMKKAWDHLEA